MKHVSKYIEQLFDSIHPIPQGFKVPEGYGKDRNITVETNRKYMKQFPKHEVQPTQEAQKEGEAL